MVGDRVLLARQSRSLNLAQGRVMERTLHHMYSTSNKAKRHEEILKQIENTNNSNISVGSIANVKKVKLGFFLFSIDL